MKYHLYRNGDPTSKTVCGVKPSKLTVVRFTEDSLHQACKTCVKRSCPDCGGTGFYMNKGRLSTVGIYCHCEHSNDLWSPNIN